MSAMRPNYTIDLTTALPPSPAILDTALQDAMTSLSSTTGRALQIRQNRPGGGTLDAATGASLLQQRFPRGVDEKRIIVTNGTQSALLLLFARLLTRGSTLITECLTYAVLRQLATQAGLSVKGLPIDDEGIIPEALEECCQSLTGPSALFCNPTIHNPTTAVMGTARRERIAEICRRHGIPIIEDDVLGLLHPDAPPPIAALAPDITWYCMSVSKCFAMGLRLAYVVAPSSQTAEDFVAPVRRLSWWFPNALSALTIGHWVETGMAGKIVAGFRRDIEHRHHVARQTLGDVEYVTKSGALHIWVPLPEHVSCEALADRALACGVMIRPADLFSADGSNVINAVRLSLTAPLLLEDLTVGLAIFVRLLEEMRSGAETKLAL